MESARVPCLLRIDPVQCLRVRGRRHAGAAGAYCANEPERVQICSRLYHRIADIELGVPASRESVGVAGAVDRAMPFVAPTPSPRPFECNVSMSDRILA